MTLIESIGIRILSQYKFVMYCRQKDEILLITHAYSMVGSNKLWWDYMSDTMPKGHNPHRMSEKRLDKLVYIGRMH